ncbi:hypothetical protein A2U01_0099227, partial [Trifolium medium]|nr:hypothetical protein [Trifolium medium]
MKKEDAKQPDFTPLVQSKRVNDRTVTVAVFVSTSTAATR